MEQPDRKIWDNIQNVLDIHDSFEEFSLDDDNVEMPEQVTDGDIVANVFCELDPEPEKVNSKNDDDEVIKLHWHH